MGSEKHTILDTEKITNESKGLLPNLSKGKYIPYSVEQLQELKEKSKFDFAYLIESSNWLKFIYSGDWEHNARLNFIRMFYYKEWKKKKNAAQPKNTDKKGQYKLL